MSGENRSRLQDAWHIVEVAGCTNIHDMDIEAEIANALRQDIDNEILHDLNMLCLPNLLRKLAPVHPTDVFPR